MKLDSKNIRIAPLDETNLEVALSRGEQVLIELSRTVPTAIGSLEQSLQLQEEFHTLPVIKPGITLNDCVSEEYQVFKKRARELGMQVFNAPLGMMSLTSANEDRVIGLGDGVFVSLMQIEDSYWEQGLGKLTRNKLDDINNTVDLNELVYEVLTRYWNGTELETAVDVIKKKAILKGAKIRDDYICAIPQLIDAYILNDREFRERKYSERSWRKTDSDIVDYTLVWRKSDTDFVHALMSPEEIEAMEENSEGYITPSLTEKGKEKLREIRDYWDYLPRHIRSLCKTDHLRRRVVENLESIPYQPASARPQHRGVSVTKLLRNDRYLTPNQKKDLSKKLEKIIETWSDAKAQIDEWCEQERQEDDSFFVIEDTLLSRSDKMHSIYTEINEALPLAQRALSREKGTYGSLIEPKRSLDYILQEHTNFIRRCGRIKKTRSLTKSNEFELKWHKSEYRNALVKNLRDFRNAIDHTFDRQTATVNKLTLRMYADKGYIYITKGRKRYPGVTVKDSLDLDGTPFYKLRIKPGPNLSRLEVIGDVCPMGLSDKWQTWKILYDPLITSAAKYYQHEDSLARVEFTTADQFFFESKNDYWFLTADEAKEFLSKAENLMPDLTLETPFFRNWMLTKNRSQVTEVDGKKCLKIDMSYIPKTLSLGVYYPLKQLLKYRKDRLK